MGQFAVPVMIASAVASAGTALYTSSIQSDMMQQQAAAQKRSIESNAKNAEIERLSKMRQAIAGNITQAVASGLAIEGTPSAFIESNLEQARNDITILRGNTAQAIAGIDAGLSGALAANRAQAAGSVIGSIGQVAAAAHVPKSPTAPKQTATTGTIKE